MIAFNLCPALVYPDAQVPNHFSSRQLSQIQQPMTSDEHQLQTLRKANVLKRIRLLGHVLDNAILIPGLNYRIGLDPLLGLFPGAGDVVSMVLSAYIVVEAARFGLSASTLIRMMLNILLEAILGTVPVVGDAMDFVWKANAQNLALLEAHLDHPDPNQSADRRVVFIVFLILGLMLAGTIALAIVVIRGVMALIGG
jgi:hypothetical protein